MAMHAARIENSPRLQRVAQVLADGQEHSTLEIVARAQVMAVSATIAELRANGRNIVCRQDKRVWYYREVQ
ncbi:hypothetical protein [Acidihalobacter prosperus]|uniref:Helix-turn-helix type 11 domain-containing protein n=1 Tax=Acidihalobacter prosperus TaxID=160660 RepID=A0A1A6C8D6_9GAMM|nr:hypothetical protein [Acidihalobacter prosperus]OBS10809.1 hypothetical protein Thpro_020525 [Acidihalobacter prosperus]